MPSQQNNPVNQVPYFSLGIAICAAVVVGISNLPPNVMPMILGSAADHFALNPRQMGLLGGSTLFGWVAGTAICFYILHRVNWRYTAAGGILFAVAGVQLSLLSDHISVLYLAWFVLGFGCSLPTCIGFEIMSQTKNQERSFAMLIFSVVFLSAIVLYLFPKYVLSEWHYTGLVFGQGLLLLSVLLFTWRLPSGRLSDIGESTAPEAVGSNRAAWIALITFLVFFAGQSGLWAFLERAGREIDLQPAEIGLVLSILKLVGGLACLTVVVIASRFGNRWPFVLGFIGILSGVALLHTGSTIAMYAAGGWLWSFSTPWYFVIPLQPLAGWIKQGRLLS